MATFSVDITKVVFAAANTGYKDITITNMPAAGVTCSITGTDSSKFGYRLPGSDPSVYRVYTTTDQGSLVGPHLNKATFKITNAGDSTDYVTVSLIQLDYGYVSELSSDTYQGTIYDVIVDNPTMINSKRDESAGYVGMQYNIVCFNANKGDYSTAKCTLLLDSGWSIPTSSNYPSWISITSETAYTDTGFKKVYVSVTNNYDGPRQFLLYFGGEGSSYPGGYGTLYVQQDGYPGTTSGCTAELSYPKAGGSNTATLNHPTAVYSWDEFYGTGNLNQVFGSGNWSISYSSVSANRASYVITLASNTDSEEKVGYIDYKIFNSSSLGASYLGHTVITQAGDAPTPTLSVDPVSLSYPASGGGRVLDVTYAAPLTTNESSFPNWLSAVSVSVDNSNASYTITAASNETSVARSFNFELADANMSTTVPITQDAGTPVSLSINPTADSVSSSSGSVQVTVTSSGITNVSYNISDTSWLNYSGKSGNVYTFGYSANSSSSQRQNTIVFSGGGLSRTYTLTQAGQAASLVVSPTAESVSSSSGSVQVTVTGNVGAVSYSISDTSWLHYSSVNNGVYTFSYDANTGSQRQSVVTFSGGGLSRTYTLTQAAGSTASLTVSPAAQNAFNTSGTASCTVTASGGTGSVTYSISDNWLTFSNISGSNYFFDFTANATTSSRTAVVTFTYSGITRTFTVTQAAGSSSIVPNPAYMDLASSAASNKSVAVTYSGGVFLTSDVPAWITDLQYSGSGSSGVRTYYFGVTQNTLPYGRAWYMHLYNDNDSVYVPIIQQGTTAASITIDPTVETVSGSSGSVTVVVDHPGINQGDMRAIISDTSWITANGYSDSYYYGSSYYQRRTYYFNYSANTGTSQRSATIEFTGLLRTATYTLTQNPGSVSPSLSVSPSVVNVSRSAGTTSTTVTVNNPGTGSVSRSISGNWLTYTSTSGNIYNFSYSQNTGSSSRTATVTFSYPGATSVTFTVNQAGTAPVPTTSPSLVAYPKKLVFKSNVVNTIKVYFKKYPSAGVSYMTTYTDGSGWLTVENAGDAYAVTAAVNTGIRRRATIRFYETGNSGNYVDVPVIQGSSEYYESIWMDRVYVPDDYQQYQTEYYYGLLDVDTNGMIYTGIAIKPSGWGGVGVGGIDIPRIVEDKIDSHFLQNVNTLTWGPLYGDIIVDLYNLSAGSPGVFVDRFKYWNDWSRCVERYDYTRYLNDPINGKGCSNMYIPVCVYYDDAATFSIVDNETSGSVQTYTLPTPSDYKFVQMTNSFYGTDRLDFKQDNDIIFSYDLTYCGKGALLYRNRFGGYDSFLIEGNIIKTDNYNKLNYRKNGLYNNNRNLTSYTGAKYMDEKYTDTVEITTTYEAHTGWLTDEESERLVFHLLSSPEVYFQDLDMDRYNYNTNPLVFDIVSITNTSSEYKKFRNGKRLVKYTITFEDSNTKKVRS